MSLSDYKFNEETNKYICPECGKEYPKYGIGSHFWRNHTEEGQKFNPDCNRGYAEGTRVVWNKGLTKETDERIRKSIETHKQHVADGTVVYKGIKLTEEQKKKHSEIMKQAVLEHKDSYSSSNVCGRVKIQEYNGMKFHGKWEVEVAKWLDRNNIKFFRDEITPFEYFWNGNTHLYFPDFYLPDFDIYIEVKGYETERDRCKWKSVKRLVVFKKNEIEQIKNNAPETHLVESFLLKTEEAGFKSQTEHHLKAS